MNRSIWTSIFFFLLAVQYLHGQGLSGAENRVDDGTERGPSLAALERKAIEVRADGDYAAAMQYYGRILKGDSLHVQALRGYGEMALATSAPERAEWAFQKLVDHKLIGADGLPLLRLADVKFRLGKYAEAQQLYRRFLYIDTPTGMTADALKDAQNGLANAEWAQEMTEGQAGTVTLFEMDSTINTRQYSEYSPYPVGDTLWFASYSFPFKGDKHNPQRHLIKVKQAIAGENSLAVSTANFNEEKLHTAQVTFNQMGDAMYYTIGRFVNSADIQFELYERRRAKDRSWGPAIKLPATLNMPGYTTTEPNVGHLAAQGEVLFFVSDRPGGKGKRDIWYSSIVRDSMGRDTFLQPVNLDSINTTEDDVTPFYHNRTQTLYFSTMGYPTLGGFDIYKTIGQGQDWTTPQNLGPSINGNANDVYYALNGSGKTAFFASNRRGDTNYSEEACCYDIYQANLVKPEMVAVTFNRETRDSLSTTEMQLIEITPNGPKNPIKIQVAGNNFPFPLEPGKKYMLVATKTYFSPDTLLFETPSVVWNDILVQKLYLPPARINLVATVYDKESGKPLPGTTARFIDLGPVGPALPVRNPDTTTNEKGNRYDYKLDFNHRYKVVVQKLGYTVDSTEVTTVGLTQTTTIEKKLDLTRGISLEALVFNELTKEPLSDVTFRLVEVPSGKKDEVTNTDRNDYHSTLGFEKRYRIIATRPGYSTDSLDFATPDIASVDFVTLHKELFLRPLDLSMYLPFNLYFDNDEPDKRTILTTTKKLYSETYFAYYPRKQEFIDRYSEGLTGAARDSAIAELDLFFEQDVKGGWNRLRIFTEVLYDMLRKGEAVHITIRGHASPRAASGYNMRLTARRITSILNHFSDFESGYLNKYIESGKLLVTEEPTGESEAPKGIEDVEERGSIYSVRASKERRVEIIGVEIKR